MEDYTTYIKEDRGNALTITARQIQIFDVGWGSDTYVMKDMGVEHFGDFEHFFSAKADVVSDGGTYFQPWAVTNGSTTRMECESNAEGLLCIFAPSGNEYTYITIIDYATGNSDFRLIPGITQKWCIIRREDVLLTCEIYDTSERNNLIDMISITCDTTRYRYILAYSHRGAGGGGLYLSGDCYDLDLQEKDGADIPIALVIGAIAISLVISIFLLKKSGRK